MIINGINEPGVVEATGSIKAVKLALEATKATEAIPLRTSVDPATKPDKVVPAKALIDGWADPSFTRQEAAVT